MSFFGRRVALGSRLATGARMTVVTLAEIFALARCIAILVRIPTGASRFWCRVSGSRLVMASAGRGLDVGERGLEIWHVPVVERWLGDRHPGTEHQIFFGHREHVD
jgi:hypothetical protein